MLIVAGGILALRRLNVDAFPDVTPVQVEIDTDSQGLAPQEVEQLITFPIENEMNGIAGVTRVESISKFGLSVVAVYFTDDTDIYFAREQVFQRLADAKGNIPSGFEPTMGPITTGTGQIYLYQIVGRGKSNQELRTIQDWVIKLQLRTVPGVADVLSFGGDVKQYQVIADQQALVNYNIPLKTLFAAIQANNQNTGANFIEHGDEQYVVRGIGLVKDVEDIKNIVLAFILMCHPGLSASGTSLRDLVISIGMMVDASVVMVEYIYRHLENHREHSFREVIVFVDGQIWRPMIGAFLIISAGLLLVC